ncbi:ImpA family type VI secretion system protein [Vibrio hepatarius]|uniref:type VI secretion system protein TssA n=1 Tax=Vibrio hepatarius TaxID=171383 RepID=UPI001C08A7B0|nr:type VI secretion system ImpA family N-terminal domain-containing protein [Vibrio hepatarius]MBU2898831.1 type VI secretion system ImpA family N-terminal domain-containing protein [Vibrio hepatarius]
MVDTEALLKPISEEQPSGTYLKLDRSVYRTLRNHYNTAQSSFRQLIETPDASSNESLIEANDTNWNLVRTTTFDALTSQTKDTELLGWFITSQLFTSSPYSNLAKSTKVLVEFIESFWETLQPQLPLDKIKSEDELGRNKELIEFRIKPLLQLVGESQDSTALFMPLQLTDLIGHITFGDFLQAERSGTLSELKETAYSLYSNEIEDVVRDLAIAYQNLNAAEKLIAQECQKVGLSPVSFKFAKANLSELLKAIQYLVGDRFAPWPLDSNFNLINHQTLQSQTSSDSEVPSVPATNAQSTLPSADNALVEEANHNQATSIAGIITSRDQAFHELRKISQFFQQTEPHSPIPFLLERAIRWGYMSLPELLNEMTGGNSGAITHINQVSGMDNLEPAKLNRITAASNKALSQPSELAQTDVNAPTIQTSTESATYNERPPKTEGDTTQPDSGISNFEW